jgi:hypothetical protein
MPGIDHDVHRMYVMRLHGELNKRTSIGFRIPLPGRIQDTDQRDVYDSSSYAQAVVPASLVVIGTGVNFGTVPPIHRGFVLFW